MYVDEMWCEIYATHSNLCPEKLIRKPLFDTIAKPQSNSTELQQLDSVVPVH